MINNKNKNDDNCFTLGVYLKKNKNKKTKKKKQIKLIPESA